MAISVYLWLKDDGGNLIKGSVTITNVSTLKAWGQFLAERGALVAIRVRRGL